jgi:hypothetical protein
MRRRCLDLKNTKKYNTLSPRPMTSDAMNRVHDVAQTAFDLKYEIWAIFRKA